MANNRNGSFYKTLESITDTIWNGLGAEVKETYSDPERKRLHDGIENVKGYRELVGGINSHLDNQGVELPGAACDAFLEQADIHRQSQKNGNEIPSPQTAQRAVAHESGIASIFSNNGDRDGSLIHTAKQMAEDAAHGLSQFNERERSDYHQERAASLRNSMTRK